MSQNNDNLVSQELFNTEELTTDTQNNDAIQSEENQVENTEMNEEIEIAEENTDLNDEEVEEELTDLINQDENTEAIAGEPTKSAKKKPTQDRLTNLPIAKIKHIIKLDPEVNLVNSEALFLITKCTELFIKSLSKESFGFAEQNKKKTIAKSHVDLALTMLPIEL